MVSSMSMVETVARAQTALAPMRVVTRDDSICMARAASSIVAVVNDRLTQTDQSQGFGEPMKLKIQDRACITFRPTLCGGARSVVPAAACRFKDEYSIEPSLLSCGVIVCDPQALICAEAFPAHDYMELGKELVRLLEIFVGSAYRTYAMTMEANRAQTEEPEAEYWQAGVNKLSQIVFKCSKPIAVAQSDEAIAQEWQAEVDKLSQVACMLESRRDERIESAIQCISPKSRHQAVSVERVNYETLARAFFQHHRTLVTIGGWGLRDIHIMRPAIEKILRLRKATNVIGYGIRKTAYAIENDSSTVDDSILKLEIVDGYHGLQRFLREPLFMKSERDVLCNKPRHLAILSLTEGHAGVPREILTTIDEHSAQMPDSEAAVRTILASVPLVVLASARHVLIWEEDRAVVTDISSMPKAQLQAGVDFWRSTAPVLKAKRFEDLTQANVGYFKRWPHFRWIDVAPVDSDRPRPTQATLFLGGASAPWSLFGFYNYIFAGSR